MTTKTTKPIYIIDAHPISDYGKTMVDLYWYHSDDNDLHCTRLFNITYSFYLIKLPTMSDDTFKRYCSAYTNQYIRVQFHEGLVDTSYYAFRNNRLTAEFMSYRTSKLNETLQQLEHDVKIWYSRIDKDELSGHELLFFNNTEHPFRMCTLGVSLNKAHYYISTRYNIPLIGGAKLDTSRLSIKYPQTSLPNGVIMSGIDCSQVTLSDVIVPDSTVNMINKMTIMAYDIETYGTVGEDPDPHQPQNDIICIGVSLFHTMESKPYRRLCIQSHPMFDVDEYKVNSRAIDSKGIKYNQDTIICDTFSATKYDVYGEYPNDDIPTEYICTPDEETLLRYYIKLISDVRPQIITGFNSYNFDDNYVYVRCVRYKLDDMFLQAHSPYDITKFMKDSPQIPIFKKFVNKNTGKYDGATLFSPMVCYIDTRRLLLVENDKRFSGPNASTLNAMLSFYRTKNPYTGEISKKIDMNIAEMFQLWERKVKLYEINKYCMQDAMITGTLLIERYKVIDLITLASLSHTTMTDSVYQSTNIRVLHQMLGYSNRLGFIQLDKVIGDRRNGDIMGDRLMLTLVIVGGDVRIGVQGRVWCITAQDFAAMYPSQKEGSNIDQSSFVDPDVIAHPEKYGLTLIYVKELDDAYGKRKQYRFRNEYGDYIVEEFAAEFNINNDKLGPILTSINSHDANYEHNKRWIKRVFNIDIEPNKVYTLSDFPSSLKIPTYFLQGKSNKPNNDIVYSRSDSLQGILLNDNRKARNHHKAELAKAKNEGNHQGVIMHNAIQNAIKILSNSNYGVGGMIDLALYDPITAASVTYGSRCMIHYLTKILTSSSLPITQSTLTKCSKQIDFMLKHNACKVDMNTMTIKLPPSYLAYQDTDSNYYSNHAYVNILNDGTVGYDYETETFTHERDDSKYHNMSPESIKLVMDILGAHNAVTSDILKLLVNRDPIATGVEGNFIVARFTNRKKNYYGINYDPRMPIKLSDEAYNEDGSLRDDYDKYWKSNTIVPLSDGRYINMSPSALMGNIMHFSDYAAKNNLKCKGIQTVRRDKYMFTNYYFISAMIRDLIMMTYDHINKRWIPVPRNTSIIEHLNNIRDNYKALLRQYNDIVNGSLDASKVEIIFNLTDFGKMLKNTGSEHAMMTNIIKRLEANGKSSLVPKYGEYQYVVKVRSEDVMKRIKGIKTNGNATERSLLVDEYVDELRTMYPPSKFNLKNVSYDDYITIKGILNLDQNDYIETLLKSLLLFISDEEEFDTNSNYINGNRRGKIDRNQMILLSMTAANVIYAKEFSNEYLERLKYFKKNDPLKLQHNNHLESSIVKMYNDLYKATTLLMDQLNNDYYGLLRNKDDSKLTSDKRLHKVDVNINELTEIRDVYLTIVRFGNYVKIDNLQYLNSHPVKITSKETKEYTIVMLNKGYNVAKCLDYYNHKYDLVNNTINKINNQKMTITKDILNKLLKGIGDVELSYKLLYIAHIKRI